MVSEPRQKLDFGIKNVLLIAATVGVLSYAATLQKPSGNPSQPLLGFGVDSKELSLANPRFQAPQRSELADAVDFQNGMLKQDYVNKIYAQAAQHGAVLGAATYNMDLVKQFSDISVRTYANPNQGNNVPVQVYAQQLAAVGQNSHLSDLISAPQDPLLASRQKQFLNNLQSIAVPEQLGDYHRLLLGYYGLIFAQKQGKGDAQIAALIPQIASALDTIQGGVKNGSNVTLPAIPRT